MGGRGWRLTAAFWAAVVSVMVVAADGAGAQEPAPPSAHQPAAYTGSGPAGRRVVVFGDSLTVAATDEYQWLTSGALATSVNASNGARLWEWGPTVGNAMQQQPQANAVLLALGTVDSHDRRTWGLWDRALRNLTAAGQCTVVIEFRHHTPQLDAFWQYLSGVIARYPAVQVYDWNTTADTYSWIHEADGVHHNIYGQYGYAWALFMAQSMCA